jgi:hypothetical protein
MDYQTGVDTGSASSSYYDHADRLDISGGPRPVGGEAVESDAHRHELNDLRDQLAEITRHLESVEPQPVVGVLYPDTGPVAPWDQLQVAVVLAELRRRLTGIRVLACSATADATTLFDGEPVYPLLGAAEIEPITIDCLVAPGPGQDAAVELSGRLGVPAHCLGTGWVGGPYDVLVLIDRVLHVQFIAERSHYLRILGTVPRSARFMLASFDVEDPSSSELAATARTTDLESVVLADQVAPTDLVGMLGAADLVVTDRPAVAALSIGLLQPVLLVAEDDRKLKWAEDAGIVSGMRFDLVALASDVFAEEAPRSREQLVRTVDLSLDAMAGSILTSLGGAIARTAGARLTDLVARVQVLESVNEGLRRTMVRDRRTLYDRIAALDAATVATALVPASRSRMQMHPRTAAEAEIHIAQLKDELGRVYSTRLFRYSKPVRSFYGRMRSLVR